MNNETELKKIALWIVIAILGVLVYFLVRPVFSAVLGGLILAYIFLPAYKKLLNIVKRKSLSAFIISLLVIIALIIPVWFLVPVMLQQVFNLFTASQSIDVNHFLSLIFPTSSQQFISQMAVAANGFIGKITTLSLNYLNSLFLEIPLISLNLIIVFFVFFYGLRDNDKLISFISELSPFTKSKEKLIIEHFENLTDSIIYGQVIIGLVQGGLAGLGFLIFGIPNVLVLTILAIFLSILPILGPFIIWIPLAIFFFASGNIGAGTAYLIYNILVVSTVDNILRMYLVSRKTNISPAVVLVAMIGGVIIFGILGIFLGPLIVAYFLMFLKAFKDKNLNSLIHETEDNKF